MERFLVADALTYALAAMDVKTVNLAPIAREAFDGLAQATISASLQLVTVCGVRRYFRFELFAAHIAL
jgi:hypothetical protein